MIQYIRNKDIDYHKWDIAIDTAFNGLVYAYSYYLDLVSDEWDALVEDDYKFVFPLVNRKKFGIKYIYTPFFVQQLGLFGPQPPGLERLSQFLSNVPSSFRHIEINLNHYNPTHNFKKTTSNVNYILSLTPEYQNLFKNYSQNLKRNLKKARKTDLTFSENINPESIVTLFRENRGINIKALGEDEYRRFTRLAYTLIHRANAFTIGLMDEHNQLCAGAVFFKSHNRLTFIFSGLNEKGKELGAMPLLIDKVIQQYCNQNLILDFEGSNDKNLARFYAGFGADIADYQSYRTGVIPDFVLKIWQSNRI